MSFLVLHAAQEFNLISDNFCFQLNSKQSLFWQRDCQLTDGEGSDDEKKRYKTNKTQAALVVKLHLKIK